MVPVEGASELLTVGQNILLPVQTGSSCAVRTMQVQAFIKLLIGCLLLLLNVLMVLLHFPESTCPLISLGRTVNILQFFFFCLFKITSVMGGMFKTFFTHTLLPELLSSTHGLHQQIKNAKIF